MRKKIEKLDPYYGSNWNSPSMFYTTPIQNQSTATNFSSQIYNDPVADKLNQMINKINEIVELMNK